MVRKGKIDNNIILEIPARHLGIRGTRANPKVRFAFKSGIVIKLPWKKQPLIAIVWDITQELEGRGRINWGSGGIIGERRVI